MMEQDLARVIHCTTCGAAELESMVSFGKQPLSTRFHAVPSKVTAVPVSELSLGYCKRCGSIQLVARFPLQMLQAKFPAARFREPKDHLPAVVRKLSALGGFRRDARLLGLSYIDDDLLSFFENTVKIASVDYSGLNGWGEQSGLETIQSLLTNSESVKTIKLATGLADVLSARFILEHAESALDFLGSISELVRPDGYIVIEVPDSEKMFAASNHALVWEDHFTYFTADTLSDLVTRAGLTVVDIARYAYAYEDTLVAIIRVAGKRDRKIVDPDPASAESIREVHKKLTDFANTFKNKKRSLRTKLKNFSAGGEKLAIFGAGHHAAKYINFYDIKNEFEFVVDDNPDKVGLYVSGTDLCVRTSQYLLSSSVTTCLTALSSESEHRVRQSIAAFFDDGGKFIPMFNLTGADDDY